MSLPRRQVKRCDVMPTRLSVAMAISTALHVAMFLIVGWLLRDVAVPSLISSPLLVSIEPYSTAGDVADDIRLIPKAESVVANPEENRHASRASDMPSEKLEVLEMVSAAELDPPDLQAATESTSAEKKAAVIVEDPAEVVTTSRSDEPEKLPVLAKAAPTHKQEKMLKRKVREWTEDLDDMSDLVSGLTWDYKGQEYLAKFTQVPAADEMGIQRVIVEISTEENGKRLSSEVRMKRLAFSNFAQFVNRWDPDVEIHNDELDGRFHSNTGIYLSHDRNAQPLFHGKVTTTSRSINVGNGRGPRRHDSIFLGGLETGVRAIRLPKHFLPFPSEAKISDDQVHYFNEDTRITFQADGSYVWQALDSESPRHRAIISDETTYFIADRKVSIHVQGTVNGKVLVYSPERIVIEGNLVYEQNPEEVPDADDYLGLVSDKYVDIAPPDVTGPGDLSIDAAIYAKRRFGVRGYRHRESALLRLYGSLSVGSLSATEPRYNTRIRFDQRLEELRPPGFPMTSRYEVESWDTIWDVEPIE